MSDNDPSYDGGDGEDMETIVDDLECPASVEVTTSLAFGYPYEIISNDEMDINDFNARVTEEPAVEEVTDQVSVEVALNATLPPQVNICTRFSDFYSLNLGILQSPFCSPPTPSHLEILKSFSIEPVLRGDMSIEWGRHLES